MLTDLAGPDGICTKNIHNNPNIIYNGFFYTLFSIFSNFYCHLKHPCWFF